MLYYALLVLLILDAVILSAVVLLQAGQGGGLASLGGGMADNVIGGRHAATLLTRMTWWCGGIFMALSLLLSVVSIGRGTGASELQQRLRETAPVSAPLPIQEAPGAAPVPAGDPAQTAQPAPDNPPE